MNPISSTKRKFLGKLLGGAATLAGWARLSNRETVASVGNGMVMSQLTLAANSYTPGAYSNIIVTALLSRLDGVVDGTLSGVPIEFRLGNLTYSVSGTASATGRI